MAFLCVFLRVFRGICALKLPVYEVPDGLSGYGNFSLFLYNFCNFGECFPPVIKQIRFLRVLFAHTISPLRNM